MPVIRTGSRASSSPAGGGTLSAGAKAILDEIAALEKATEAMTRAAREQVDAAKKTMPKPLSMLPPSYVPPDPRRTSALGRPEGKGGTYGVEGMPGSRDTYVVKPADGPKMVQPIVDPVAAAEAKAPAGAPSALGEMAGKLIPAFQGVRMAAGQVQGVFGKITGTIMPFVNAFNPTAVMMFQAAMRDLTATVGQALVPVMHGATQVIRLFAAVLNPVMERLVPVFQEITDLAVEVADQAMTALAEVFKALEPFIAVIMDVVRAMMPIQQAMMQVVTLFVTMLQPLLAIFAALLRVLLVPLRIFSELVIAFSPILQALTAIMSGLGAVVQEFVSGLLGPIMGMVGPMTDLRGTVQMLAKAMIALAARVALMFGDSGRTFIAGMLRNLQGGERKDATGKAAPINAAIQDLNALSRQGTTSALIAGSGAKSTKPEDIMKDIREILSKTLDTNSPEWIDALCDRMWDVFKDKNPRLAAFFESASSTVDPNSWMRAAQSRLISAASGGLL